MKRKISFNKLKESKWWHIGLLVALPILIYAQTLSFDYTNFDDNGIIRDKIDVIKDIKNIDTVLYVDAFFNKSGDFYRPVQNATFMLDAAVSGKDLWMFHITNLIIHILTCISLYFFLQFLGLKRYTAFLLAMLFSVHPLFASGVGWIPSRGDILIGLEGVLLFLTFGLYFKTRNVLYLILHVLLFLITIFTKETTVLFPLLLVYFYFLVLRNKEEGSVPRSAWIRLAIFGFFWVGIVGLYLFMRKGVVANTGATADVLGIIPFFKNNTVIPTILGKFFVPINLSTLPLYDNVTTIIGIIFLLGLLYLVVEYSIAKKWAVLMGLLWFLFFSVPPTIYRLENADTFFNYLEHRTYLPMIGIVIILGFFLDDQLKSEIFRRRFILGFIPLVFIFGVLAFVHAADYKNNFTLSSRAAKLNNPSGLSMRAGNYIEKKDTVNALADINKAIELSPRDANMFYMRGKIRAKMQQHEAAEQDFTLTLSLNPYLNEVYAARSVERRILKKYEGAFRDIYTAISHDTANPKLYMSMGNLFVAVENYGEAIGSFNKAISIFPKYSEAYNNRGYAKLKAGDFEGAIEDCNKALELKVNSPYVYNNLGQAYREINKMEKAFESFNKAIEMDKNFGLAYFEKALAWEKLNAEGSACADFKKAFELGIAAAKEKVEKYCK